MQKGSEKTEMAIGANQSPAHLSLIVVQVEVLGVLLLPIPPPPLGRGASLGPPRTQTSTPLSCEGKRKAAGREEDSRVYEERR